MKRPSNQEMSERKEALYQGLAMGEIGIREATREMRKILGMTQRITPRRSPLFLPGFSLNLRTAQGIRPWRHWKKLLRPLGLKSPSSHPSHGASTRQKDKRLRSLFATITACVDHVRVAVNKWWEFAARNGIPKKLAEKFTSAFS